MCPCHVLSPHCLRYRKPFGFLARCEPLNLTVLSLGSRARLLVGGTELMAGERSIALDGLRGTAALTVLFYHAILYQNASAVAALDPPVQGAFSTRDAITKIALTVANGQSAVLLFFVLSGFVLNNALRSIDGSALAICYKFTMRRLFRIYPGLLFCMAFCYFLAWPLVRSPWFADSPDLQAAANINLVLQNALLSKITMQGATWTLQSELLAVPFLLGAFFLGRRLGALAVVLCLAASVMAVEAAFLTFNLPTMSGVLFAFMGGAVLADTRETQHNEVGAWLAVVFFLLARLFVPLHSTTAMIAQVIAACCLVYAAFNARSGPFYDALSSRPLRFLGRISFSLYLINVPVMWVVGSVVKRAGFNESNPLEAGIVVGILVTLITLPIASFSEKWVEQGGIRLGRMLTTSRHLPVQPIVAPAE